MNEIYDDLFFWAKHLKAEGAKHDLSEGFTAARLNAPQGHRHGGYKNGLHTLEARAARNRARALIQECRTFLNDIEAVRKL